MTRQTTNLSKRPGAVHVQLCGLVLRPGLSIVELIIQRSVRSASSWPLARPLHLTRTAADELQDHSAAWSPEIP
jgi:hypothetical protein